MKKEEYELYRLIWNRFLASQMSPAEVEETQFDIKVDKYTFVARGEVVKFKGFLGSMKNSTCVLRTPETAKVNLERQPSQKKKRASCRWPERVRPSAWSTCRASRTSPSPRRAIPRPPWLRSLEARGIGRPSTYAPIISTLQDRTYVIKEEGRFRPTDLGFFVTDFLVKNFAELFDYKFTARMEENSTASATARLTGWRASGNIMALAQVPGTGS